VRWWERRIKGTGDKSRRGAGCGQLVVGVAMGDFSPSTALDPPPPPPGWASCLVGTTVRGTSRAGRVDAGGDEQRWGRRRPARPGRSLLSRRSNHGPDTGQMAGANLRNPGPPRRRGRPAGQESAWPATSGQRAGIAGDRTLKVATRVRIPLGVQDQNRPAQGGVAHVGHQVPEAGARRWSAPPFSTHGVRTRSTVVPT